MKTYLSRRDFLKALGFGASAVTLQGCVDPLNRCRSATSTARPNIILLMADDLGYGDVGFNGNTIIKTPNLDAMTEDGIRFTRFYAGGPVCSPTRATCLTGRHYFRYGIFSASIGYLPAEEITIARICKSLGYTTGFFGKWHLGPLSRTGPTLPEYYEKRQRKYAPPWERDYDEAFATTCNVPTFNPADNKAYKEVFRLPFWHNGRIVTDNLEGPASKIVMDRALHFIRRAVKNEKPFFATIWFHEPHEPVVAGPKYRAMYKQYSQGEQHYYGSITAMDEQIGRLRAELEKLGIAQNTMIWFCSDNGPEGMTSKGQPSWCKNSRGVTAGLRGRKRSLFEGGIRVPALLVWPGSARRGHTTNVPCSTLDYLPTICDLLGYKIPDSRPIDGISLLALLQGRFNKRRPKPIPFWFAKPSKKAMHGSPTIALIDNNYKFLTNLSKDGSEDMLFDLNEDPGENTNLIEKYPHIAADMKTWLKNWTESCRKSHSGADYPTPFTPVNDFPKISGTWRK